MADNPHLLSTIDSEKITAKKTRLITCLLFNDKLPPILTFVSAVIAFSISLVALLSGAEKGQLQDYEVVVVCFCLLYLQYTPSLIVFGIVEYLNHSSKRNKGGKCSICHSSCRPTPRVQSPHAGHQCKATQSPRHLSNLFIL
jgi:hypothetical protein